MASLALAVPLAVLLAAPFDSAQGSQPDVAAVYGNGMKAARDAYSQGGSEESLAPVREAMAALAAIGGGAPGPAEIARLVLAAAAAAAQSEREEMGAFLTHATEMEVLQLAAGQPGAPGISALEAAGDLWLQVHRYEDARRAYERAAAILGTTEHITAGLARIPPR
jgi:hypothetical protein